MEKVKAWATEHVIKIALGFVSPDDPKLAGWNIHPMATSMLVLTNRKKRAVASYTDLEVDELIELETKLDEVMKP